jgi:hypothetical protein
MKDVDRIRRHTGVRNTVQGVLLGYPIHTISYTIPPLPTAPPQKRKLPDGQFCIEYPGSSFTVSVRLVSSSAVSTSTGISNCFQPGQAKAVLGPTPLYTTTSLHTANPEYCIILHFRRCWTRKTRKRVLATILLYI